ncbi:MAG: hypothetical protein R3F61_31885 [Myxococcota bacterium]
MSDAELRDLVAKAIEAIDKEDARTHREVLTTLEGRVPCLEGQMPSRPWADFLVTEALIRYADQLPDWDRPLQLALDLVPDHPDVPAWLLDEYRPPAPPVGDPMTIPDGRLIVIDGRVIVGTVPPLSGLHVIQTVADGKWRSMLLRGQPFPREWFVVVPDKPEREVTDAYASWGAAGLSAAFGAWGQRPPGTDDSGLIADRSAPGVGIGLSTHGQQSLFGPVAAFWTADGSVQLSGPADGSDSGTRPVPFGSLFAGAALFDQPLSVWIGGGVLNTRISTFDGEQGIVLPHYLVGVSFRSRDPIGIDVMGGGGWGPWGAHFQARGGATLVDLGPAGLRLGARATWADATLLDFEPDDRPVIGRSSRWEGGLDLGISWGIAE